MLHVHFYLLNPWHNLTVFKTLNERFQFCTENIFKYSNKE